MKRHNRTLAFRIGHGLAALALLAGAAFFSTAGPIGAAEQTAAPLKGTQSLGMSSDQPIQFESEQLEVHQEDQEAIFTGNVLVRQGKTVLKTDRLVVHYTGSLTGEGNQQVKSLDAVGNVLVTSGDQTASGDKGTFNTASNTITLTGNVVLSQGENIIRGTELVINTVTNEAKMAGGRVQMLIAPKSLKGSDPQGAQKTGG